MSPSSSSTGNCSKIRRIVRLRQMLLRWRKKARITTTGYDVPEGHVAVCVGPSMRRFVVRASYLNHPIFKKLLMQAEEEYGFCNHGPLAIPCDESLFEEVLRVMARPEPRFSTLEDFQRRCHVDVRSSSSSISGFDQFVGESRPLLHDDPICWVSELVNELTRFFFFFSGKYIHR
jgi:SAUR family protein